MVSRRKILSQSRDELSYELNTKMEEEDDVWFTKEKLFKDHIQEVLDKWESIDDEIWAKVVVLERNRRVAKAYARAPVITVNGTEQGFDGFRIGVAGFENPMRDVGTEEIIKQINQGFKLKMDDMGNILIKRLCKSQVYARQTGDESALSNDILKLNNGLLEHDKPFKLFEMKKYQNNLNRELKRQYPDRRKLEAQCISLVSFGTSQSDILDSPIWILVINVVAMEMLRSKLPPLHILDNRRIQTCSSDEDPYSIAGSGSSGSSGNGNTRPRFRSNSRDVPPQLPPRDNIYGTVQPSTNQWEEKREKKGGDDPYYFGLSARIPNFVKSRKKKQKERDAARSRSTPGHEVSSGHSSLPAHPFWWHNRIYTDNSTGSPAEPVYGRTQPSFGPYDSSDSDYSHIYGRLPIPTRGVRKFPSKPLFLSHWE
ncbi:uncharacterized protein LOC111701371 [Eurytemora carolleeae]|uniref:uncharacterized protein LOC111701371 n=1 Tax=Eurytemora carolleeae TaxID=1294199 RepID=UPI000C777DAC|nr:uncharacterized protein LOC111701371 [Eurytemora carolleeae]|eukprot:XP_023328397.1 uncharacterized protein LOC111701371 [Eurytemora affinis]